MTAARAPWRAVTASRLGPRSQRIQLPDGGVAIVCGPAPRTDTLECGHEVVTYGGRADRRRCKDCAGVNLRTCPQCEAHFRAEEVTEDAEFGLAMCPRCGVEL